MATVTVDLDHATQVHLTPEGLTVDTLLDTLHISGSFDHVVNLAVDLRNEIGGRTRLPEPDEERVLVHPDALELILSVVPASDDATLAACVNHLRGAITPVEAV